MNAPRAADARSALDYPRWICSPCGKKYGRGWPKGHVATFHFDTCGICGAETSVTEPRDFGHLKPGWAALASAARAEQTKEK